VLFVVSMYSKASAKFRCMFCAITATTRMGLHVTWLTCGAGQNFTKFENQPK
jgi:hypothetical protein